VPAYGPQNDVTLKMPAFEWVHVQLHQQKGMISLSPPTICNSAINAIATPYFLSVISEIIIIIVINKDNVIARICVIIINIVAMNDDNLAIGV
ncbi:hypothetical protein ACFH5T_24340, partial [Escherichia coli]